MGRFIAILLFLHINGFVPVVHVAAVLNTGRLSWQGSHGCCSVKEGNQPCQCKASLPWCWVAPGLISRPGLGCSHSAGPSESSALQPGVRGRGSPGMDEGPWCSGGSWRQEQGSWGGPGVPLAPSSLPFSHCLIMGLVSAGVALWGGFVHSEPN